MTAPVELRRDVDSPAWRRRLIAGSVSRGFHTLSTLGGMTPWARPAYHGVHRVDDVPYGELPEHLVDIYVPSGPGPHPVAIYVHGGGFRALSKRTHWLMAMIFARRGYLTFSVEYRLAPRHPFPAAAQDVCQALTWIQEHAAEFGGDPSRVILSGESAGGNLALVGTLAAVTERPEPWARAVYESGFRPTVSVPFCGMLQVSDPRRFQRRRRLPFYLQDVIDSCAAVYLPDDGHHPLADPLVEVERGAHAPEGWPSFFIPCGTADPLLDDSRRLTDALQAHGADAHGSWYPGEVHAFHGLIWRRNARRCWQDLFGFVEERHGLPARAAG